MEKNNNGKLAIAIVAMFVVALSIVGFTYAYFVAQVTTNSDEDVVVKAGVLTVAYEGGPILMARNVLPGWISDGKHYFDSTASYYTPAETDKNDNGVYDAGVDGEVAKLDANGNPVKAIKAVSTDDTHATPCTSQNLDECTEGTVTYENGIANGVTFKVDNTGTDVAYYGIRLVSIENGINDQDNFKITLTSTSGVTETLISGEALADDGEIQPISAAITIGTEDVHNFTLNAEYVNNINAPQTSQDATVKATVEVVGLNKVGNDFVAADGDTWTFGN